MSAPPTMLPGAAPWVRGAEYTLRLGYGETRDEAVQAAKVLLLKFRGAHTRIAPYQPDAIVAGAGEQPPIAAVPLPLTGARAPEGETRETTAQARARAHAARGSAGRRNVKRWHKPCSGEGVRLRLELSQLPSEIARARPPLWFRRYEQR